MDLREEIARQRAILDLAEKGLALELAPSAPAPLTRLFVQPERIDYDPQGSGELSLEWSGLYPLLPEGGVATLRGNSHLNSYRGYHRLLSQDPVHDPRKVLELRIKAAVLDWSTVSYNGQYTGLKFGIKYPKPKEVTGHDPDSMLSVLGGRGEKNAYTWIGVVGLGPEGRQEIARYDGSQYLPFPSPKRIPYSKGEVRDVVIRLDPTREDSWTWEVWSGVPVDSPPTFAFSGAPPTHPSNLVEDGFLWVRSDAVDVQLHSVEVIQHP